MKSTLSDCGWYNWSMVKCSQEMHDRLLSNTGNAYSCITTDDYNGYSAYKTYSVEDSWNKLVAVCGPKSNTAVNKYYFENQVKKNLKKKIFLKKIFEKKISKKQFLKKIMKKI